MSEKGSNHQLLKQSNYNLIKKYIYRNSPISRVEIAQKLGLTTATITGMVNPMISSGLLVETTAPAEELGVFRCSEVQQGSPLWQALGS